MSKLMYFHYRYSFLPIYLDLSHGVLCSIQNLVMHPSLQKSSSADDNANPVVLVPSDHAGL